VDSSTRASIYEDAVPDSVADDWRRAVPFGHLLASAVLNAAVANAPAVLGGIGVATAIRETAAALAVAQIVLAILLFRGPLPAAAARASAIATGWLLTVATARVAAVDPLPVLVLASGFLGACMLAGARTLLAAAAGAGLGLAFTFAQWPPPPATRMVLALAVEPTYADQLIAPAWFRLDYALLTAAVSIIVAGSAIAAASGSWRTRVRRYAALGRVVQARGQLSANQGALAITALADPRWNVVGVGVIQWEALRIIVAHAPGGDHSWHSFAPALRDATIPLSHENNPLVRAARQAQSTDIRSGSELTDGMWRRIATTNDARVVRARGRAIPFGNAETRGVLFALSESRADFEWLAELAGALSVLGVGRSRASEPPALSTAT